jgi:hypothetical protein
MNRLLRTRMAGGVGGERENLSSTRLDRVSTRLHRKPNSAIIAGLEAKIVSRWLSAHKEIAIAESD